MKDYFLLHKLKFCDDIKKDGSCRCSFTKLMSHVKCERNRQLNDRSRKVRPGYILKPEVDDSLRLAFPTEAATTPLPGVRKKGSVFHPSYVTISNYTMLKSVTERKSFTGIQD